MELLITLAYFFLVRMIFFDYGLLKFNLFWKFVVFGIYSLGIIVEVVMLGQYAPFSKDGFVRSYVLEIAPEYGGMVREVHVEPNTPIAQGAPLFEMDPTVWQDKVDLYEAQLAAANTDVAELNQQYVAATAQVSKARSDLATKRAEQVEIADAYAEDAVPLIRLEQVNQEVASAESDLQVALANQEAAKLALDSEVGTEHTAVAEILAELSTAQYNLENTIVRAPHDGYVVNLQLRPGVNIRLKAPVLTFVSEERHFIVARILQRATQHINEGDPAEVAFDMYPGKVFPAQVESIVFATGETATGPSGKFPREMLMTSSPFYLVRLKRVGEWPEHPLKFGARSTVAIYTNASPGFANFLRKLEVRSQSWLFYLYNPF